MAGPLLSLILAVHDKLEQLGHSFRGMSRGQPRAGCGTDEANKLWINLDGCGLFTAGITQALQLFGAVVTHVRIFGQSGVTPTKPTINLQTVVIKPWLGGTQLGLYTSAFFVVLYLLASSSHLRGKTATLCPASLHATVVVHCSYAF